MIMENNLEYWVYIGRMCPVHLGHERIINKMRDKYKERFLLILWSNSASFTLRNFFNYEERRSFIKMLFPDQKIAWIPDFKTDSEWLVALDDIICSVFGIDENVIKQKVVFAWWCREDVEFFFEDWRNVEIINRFDSDSIKISATEVRDALIYSRDLNWLVNPKLHEYLTTLFRQKWELFKKI